MNDCEESSTGTYTAPTIPHIQHQQEEQQHRIGVRTHRIAAFYQKVLQLLLLCI